jgi:MFS family permease
VSRVFFYDSIAWVIIGSTVVSVGTAIAYAAMPTLIMGVVPITETASANGLNSLVRSIGTSTSSAAVAAVLTSVSMTVGAVQLPSFEAFKDVFWLAALAAAASVVATVFIPKATAVHRPSAADTAASVNTAEIVVQGRVLAPDNRPVTPAVVTVLQTAGEPVDWSRVDTEGNYSVALPGAGKYLMVANAAGWAPMAEVFDFDGRTRHQNFLLRDRLEIGGLVTAGSKAVPGAVVTLLEASGGYVDTTLSDGDGAYAFPLPLAGRYIVTMVNPATHQAMARKLAVDNRSVTVNLAAPRVEEKSTEPVSA